MNSYERRSAGLDLGAGAAMVKRVWRGGKKGRRCVR